MFTEAELKTRQLGIGASEAAAVLGLSRYKTPLEVYVDKTKDVLTPRSDSAPAKRGRRLEPVVLDMYEEEFGALERPIPQLKLKSTKHSFMFATLDARRLDDKRPVQAKTASQWVAHEWGDEDTDDIPQECLIQITHEMIVTEKAYGDVPALLTLDDFRKYTIELDRELAEMIVEGLQNFWQRVENRDPPEPTSGLEAERFYRKSTPEAINADAATASIYLELLETRSALKPLQRRELELIDNIKLFMKDKEALIIGSTPVVTWKSVKGGRRFDVKRFQSEYSELYQSFLTQTEGSRRFLIKGENNNE